MPDRNFSVVVVDREGPYSKCILDFLATLPPTVRKFDFSDEPVPMWNPVTRVALAYIDGRIIGLGTFAPHDEIGGSQPSCIGIWVQPKYRTQKAYIPILRALSEECIASYGKPPEFLFSRLSEFIICFEAIQRGVALIPTNCMVGPCGMMADLVIRGEEASMTW